jgi:hypothetical protein
MAWIVVAIGALIAAMSLVVFVAPRRVASMLFPRLTVGTLRWATGFRIVVGALLVLAASGTKIPTLFTILGVLVILAGLALPVLGIDRVRLIAQWGLERPAWVLRIWATVVFGLAVLLVWAVF